MRKHLLFLLICGLFSAIAIAQPANDDCAGAQNLGTLPLPVACPSGIGAAVVVNGTLVNGTPMNPYTTSIGCTGGTMASPAIDVWYMFTASSNTGVFSVNSSFANPNIAVYSGTCGAFGGGVGGCAIGAANSVALTVNQMTAGNTYLIQVSSNDDITTGTFTISVRNNTNCAACMTGSSLVVNPLPVNGAYLPGQVVNFCYTVDNYFQSNTNWLHGVQVAFGNGWSGISGQVPATPVGGAGAWGWYNTVGDGASGLNFGQGFYIDLDGNGDPEDNFGDNCFDDGFGGAGDDENCNVPLTWTFCWNLTVASACNPGSNLSVQINTSGDGESGAWQDLGCSNDPAYNFVAQGSCCPPNMTSSAETCVGNDGTATATPIGANGPYDYSWSGPAGYTNNSTGVAGASTINGLAAGNYTVTITDVSLCAVTATVNVADNSVIPGPPTTAPVTYCLDDIAIPLTATPNAGGTLNWYGTDAVGGTSSATAPTPSTTIATATTYYVSQTIGGCEGPRAPLVVTVRPVPTFTVPSNATYCQGDAVPLQTLTSAPAGATFNWTNTNTTIGLAAGGVGNIPAYTAANGTAGTITGTINITLTLNGCPGTPQAYTVTVNPLPTLTAVPSETVCPNNAFAAINFVSNPAGASVNWTNSNGSIGAATSGTTNIAAFNGINAGTTAVSGNFSVTPTLNTCVGPPITFTLTVNPTPTLTAVPSQTVCSGDATTAINYVSNPVGATVNWTNSDGSIGVGISGSGNIASFNGINAGATDATGNFFATPTLNTCIGPVINFGITVSPTPTLTAVTSQTLCANAAAAAVNYVSNPLGATVNWTNSDASIGVGASGTNNITSFTATNATAITANGNFVATPTLNGCPGAPITFTITVNPVPTLLPITSETVCAGDNTTAINFSPTPVASVVNWTNTNGAIGVGTIGSGNIASFTGVNGGVTVVNGDFSATATLNGCTSAPQTFTITVNPMPVLNPVASETVCAGDATTPINYNFVPAGSTVNWTNSDGTIGVGAIGSGNIASFNGINAGTVPVTGNFSATATLNGCTSPPQTFSITVNPEPTLVAVPSETVCAGANTAAINFTPTPAAAIVNWTNTNGTIGVGTIGSGNIASFTGVNGGVTVVNGDFSATATLNGCTSAPQTFTITVNPMPVLNPVASETVCAGTATTAINYNFVPAGSTVNWTNSDGTIGVGAIGSGNIASFNGLNAGLTSVTGNFSATATLNGCTSTPQTFSITVDPTPTLAAVPSETVCAGASTTAITFVQAPLLPLPAVVNWTNDNGTIGALTAGSGNIASFTGTNSGLVPSLGSFSATATLNGCTSAPQTFTITVNPMPTLGGVPSQSVCAGNSTTDINYVPSPAASTVNWTNSDGTIGVGVLGSGNIASFVGVNGSSATVTGNFSATATLNGCTSVPQTFSITVNPLPVPVASNLGNPFYCVNGTFTLDVTPNGMTSYTWAGPLSYSSSAQSNTVTLISVPMSGTYSVTVVDNNNCTAMSTTSVTVNPLPIIVATNNGPLCVGENLILSCTPGSSYSWSGPNGYNSTLANPTIPNVTTGDAAMYSVIVTDANGCQGPSFTPVVINANPTPIANNNGPVCFDGTLDLSLDQAYATYSWTGPNSFSSVSSSPSIDEITTAEAGVYNVTITDANGCSGSASTTAIVNNLPTAALNTIAPGCAPICRDFFLASTSNLVEYSWSMGNGFVSGNDTILQHCYQLPGTYPVTCFVTDINGCSDSIHFAPISVYEVPEPQFTFGPSEVTILEPEINFVNQSIGSNIVSYAWEFGDPYHNTSGLVNPTFIYGEVGTYNVTLTVTNNRGCVDSITHPITIPEGWAIYVPNAFTPNDDGFNDDFYPKGVGIDEKDFQMWIFDRWGNQLFYTTNWDHHWDGKVAGHDNIVQQDTYIWKIAAKSFKGDKFNEVGHVHVVR